MAATTLSGRTAGRGTSVRRVALASFIGTTIEWYDYYIFGTAAVLIFNTQFFSNLSPVAGTLAALATFDDDPGMYPGRHIFTGSKAPWFEITDDLPQNDEY